MCDGVRTSSGCTSSATQGNHTRLQVHDVTSQNTESQQTTEVGCYLKGRDPKRLNAWSCLLIITESNRRIVTRSKTGSLAPRQFMDSIATGASLKTSLAKISSSSSSSSTEDVVVVNKEGEMTRVTRSKAAASAMGVSVEKHSLYFKLGECSLVLCSVKSLVTAPFHAPSFTAIFFALEQVMKQTTSHTRISTPSMFWPSTSTNTTRTVLRNSTSPTSSAWLRWVSLNGMAASMATGQWQSIPWG